ncbi:MAG: histidine kinase dimerization/phospho-acceptor domain-containing protein, partial [Candidatus Latescibacteria bacterium]|nr:histidine kinase dimerization/phospho-acceptor domain-containing protein [Candidatus Latescibacterota bacterium]
MMSEDIKARRLQEELERAISQRDLYIKELHRTTQRFEEKVRELSVVRRIGETLKYTRDPSKVFEVIIDTIIDETNAENCSLMLLNRNTNELTVRAARGQEDTEISFYHTGTDAQRTFKLGEGIAGWVAQQGESIGIPDTTSGKVVRLFPELDAAGNPVALPNLPAVPEFVGYAGRRSIGSMFCLPLVIDNEVVGVVNLSHPLPDAFSSEDSQLMTIITDQVAIALNNMQIFDDLQQQSVLLEDEVGRATQELQKTNEELQAAYNEIQKSSKMKSQFLAHMSHELRTPLNAIIGFSEILEDHTFGDLNERQNRYVGNILTSSRHLLDLINEILDLAKVE